MAAEFDDQRDPFGDVKIYARLSDNQANDLLAWARQQVALHPPLQGRYFRPDHRPKMGAILRGAALAQIKNKEV